MRMRKLYLGTLSNSCEWNVYVYQESRPGIPPSHHQMSPSPFLLDSLPSFHTPVTKHILSCSPFALSLYSVLTHHLVWLDCICVWISVCMCYCVVYCSACCSLLSTTTALPSVVSRFCYLFSFLPVGLFVYIKIRAYMLLDPDPCFSLVPLARTVTESSQLIWVQRGNSLTSVREMGALRSTAGTSGKSLVGRR